MYLTAQQGKSVYRVDLQTGEINEKQFDSYATRVAVKNGKLYVALQCAEQGSSKKTFGAVAVIDTATFSTQTILNVSLVPFDIEVDDNGYVYLSDTDEGMASYRIDGKKISSWDCFYLMYLEKNPKLSKIFMVDSGVSPTDIFACEISDGIFGNNYDSPYHGYPMSTYQRLSPDGTRIFNGSGNMFVCRDGKTGDMEYCGTLGQPFAAICFDLPHDRFYTAKDKMLTAYSYGWRLAFNLSTLRRRCLTLKRTYRRCRCADANKWRQYAGN
jgi:hypothetical protein